jgi:hypothetical protein
MPRRAIHTRLAPSIPDQAGALRTDRAGAIRTGQADAIRTAAPGRRAGQPMAATTWSAMCSSPSWLGWKGAAGEVGMSPSIHLVPGSWQAS